MQACGRTVPEPCSPDPLEKEQLDNIRLGHGTGREEVASELSRIQASSRSWAIR